MLAQAEQFFFGKRALQVSTEASDHVTLPISWPTQSLEELPHYERMSPKSRRPWWRFW
jgi:hypothetical protein